MKDDTKFNKGSIRPVSLLSPEWENTFYPILKIYFTTRQQNQRNMIKLDKVGLYLKLPVSKHLLTRKTVKKGTGLSTVFKKLAQKCSIKSYNAKSEIQNSNLRIWGLIKQLQKCKK